jgi:hypothetical protein
LGSSRRIKDRQYCERLQRALEKSLDSLGREPKEALLFHLMHTYNIAIGGTNCSSLEDIENTLAIMLGKGSEIVMLWIKAELENENQ